jgi:hypothetical protein
MNEHDDVLLCAGCCKFMQRPLGCHLPPCLTPPAARSLTVQAARGRAYRASVAQTRGHRRAELDLVPRPPLPQARRGHLSQIKSGVYR